MSSLEQEYNGILAGQKEEAAAEREVLERAQGIQEGVNWKFGVMPVSERPVIQVTCSGCRTRWFIEKLEVKLKHCGVVSVAPPELIEQLKAAQIKRGLRAAEGVQGFVDRLLGKKPEPTPALNNF